MLVLSTTPTVIRAELAIDRNPADVSWYLDRSPAWPTELDLDIESWAVDTVHHKITATLPAANLDRLVAALDNLADF